MTPSEPRFYKWFEAPYAGHWFLNPVEDWASSPLQWELVKGAPLAGAPAFIDLTISTPGTPMDFGCTAMGIPVVSSPAADVLRRVAPADVQLIPCRIAGAQRG